MRKTYVNQKRDNVDFNIIQYGTENCCKNYSIGNFVRKNYLLHYIYDGKGIYKANGKTYHLKKGQAFLIFPDEVTYYQADDKEPWTYSWIEFSGSKVPFFLNQAGLSIENPIFTEGEPYEVGKSLAAIINEGNMEPYKLTGLFYLFANSMVKNVIKEENPKREYIEKALNYIHTFHWRKTTVSDVASFVGINRSYLTRLFCEYVKMPPKKYIFEYHMKVAAELLKNPKLSIKNVALSVGYDDQMNFSKAFRSYFNVSPTQFRNNL